MMPLVGRWATDALSHPSSCQRTRSAMAAGDSAPSWRQSRSMRLAVLGLGPHRHPGAGQAQVVEPGVQLVGQRLGHEGGRVDPFGRWIQHGLDPQLGRGQAGVGRVARRGPGPGGGPVGPRARTGPPRRRAGNPARSPSVRSPRRTSTSIRPSTSARPPDRRPARARPPARAATGRGARKAGVAPGATTCTGSGAGPQSCPRPARSARRPARRRRDRRPPPPR